MMNRLTLITGFALLIPLPANADNPPTAQREYLAPQSGMLSGYNHQFHYHSLLRQILLKDAEDADMAWMICTPSFTPEWWVRIKEVAGGRYEVQSAEASRNIWYADGRNRLDRVSRLSQVRIRRWRAPIEKELAVRYPPHQGNRLMRDGTNYYFDCFDRSKNGLVGNGILAGHTYTPYPDSLPYQLAALGGLLKRYAQASPTKRAALLPEINDRLNRVAERQQHVYPSLGSG